MPMFDKDGKESKGKFRVYCYHKGCQTFIMGKWGGGYCGIVTKNGTFDARNKIWLCSKHAGVHE